MVSHWEQREPTKQRTKKYRYNERIIVGVTTELDCTAYNKFIFLDTNEYSNL